MCCGTYPSLACQKLVAKVVFASAGQVPEAQGLLAPFSVSDAPGERQNARSVQKNGTYRKNISATYQASLARALIAQLKQGE